MADPPPELISLQRSGSGDRSSILADRLGKLETASQVNFVYTTRNELVLHVGYTY